MQAEGQILYAEHAQDILAATLDLMRSGEPCALVTSLNIEGGAAREIGSLAVISGTGDMIGYLSNGCIDRDIIHHGMAAIDNGQLKHLRYGAGSPYLDLKLPCGGALELVIDPAPDLAGLEAALAHLLHRQKTVLSFAGRNGPVQIEYTPKPALILAGRGAILRTTAQLAAHMDFELHLASPDFEDLACLEELNPTTRQSMTSPSAPIDLAIDAYSAVLLVFHDHEWEQAILMQVTQNKPFFIGALGSRKTHAMRVERLKQAGLSETQCAQIQGPIGLVPSLRNASLIAVSALAEITAKLPPFQVRLPSS
ncbi:XdhC family protein [uncultured Planktomarina sp.]|uniref:XdhC family protein n=1 Tax=uncultured Planktomarina sp. TaxID=1538529 RepID=UPI0032603A30